MSDSKIAYQILFDEIYSGDQLVFEIELSKIKDDKLRIGLLTELYSKSDSYKCDKEKIINQISIFGESTLSQDELFEYQKYFVSKMKDYLIELDEPSVSELEDLVSFITWLTYFPNIEYLDWSNSEEITQRVKSMSPKTIEFLKSNLLKSERYEEIVQIDKIFKK